MLKPKKILTIGATSAIAAETLKLFARDGDELFLVARNESKLNAVAADLVARGAGRVERLVLDLSNFAAHTKLLSQAREALGGLDLVLFAHGTLGNQKSCERDYAEAEKEFRTNFLSIVSILTPIANYFEECRAGTIAVVSSVAGDRGRQSNYIYGTAKGALNIFLQGLRNRLYKSSVHVLTIKPGFVDTPMTASLDKGPLFVGPDLIAQGIYNAVAAKRNEVYLPWFWAIIMGVIKMIPEGIFKRMKL